MIRVYFRKFVWQHQPKFPPAWESDGSAEWPGRTCGGLPTRDGRREPGLSSDFVLIGNEVELSAEPASSHYRMGIRTVDGSR
jgi:hypothetical protein